MDLFRVDDSANSSLERNGREMQIEHWRSVASAATRWLDLADKSKLTDEEAKERRRLKRHLMMIALEQPQTHSVPGMKFEYVVLAIRQFALRQNLLLRAPCDSSSTQTDASEAKKETPAEEQPKRKANPRDKYCYEQMAKHRSLKEIMAAVNKRKGWEPIATVQGISAAARRYANANGLTWPLNMIQR